MGPVDNILTTLSFGMQAAHVVTKHPVIFLPVIQIPFVWLIDIGIRVAQGACVPKILETVVKFIFRANRGATFCQCVSPTLRILQLHVWSDFFANQLPGRIVSTTEIVKNESMFLY